MDTTPILTPLKKLFASRKFILAVTVIVTALITRAVPTLLPYADVITNIVLFVFGALFLHLSAEDIIVNLRTGLPTTIEQAQRDAAQEAVDSFVPRPGAAA